MKRIRIQNDAMAWPGFECRVSSGKAKKNKNVDFNFNVALTFFSFGCCFSCFYCYYYSMSVSHFYFLSCEANCAVVPFMWFGMFGFYWFYSLLRTRQRLHMSVNAVYQKQCFLNELNSNKNKNKTFSVQHHHKLMNFTLNDMIFPQFIFSFTPVYITAGAKKSKD